MRLGETWRTAEPRQWRLLQPEAQRMRRAPTAAESALWNALRNGALGARFRRQQVVDRFVVDFCCLRAKLAVEVDGPIHRHRTAEDAARDAALVERGFRVLRFPNQRIVNDLDGVLEEIRQHLVADPVNRSPASSRNSPSPVGEGAGG